MTFDDLKDVESGTVLVDKGNNNRIFISLIKHEFGCITKCAGDDNPPISWREVEIHDWTFKPKVEEKKVKKLYAYQMLGSYIITFSCVELIVPGKRVRHPEYDIIYHESKNV